MPLSLVDDASSFPANVRAPSAAELRTAESVQMGMQDLANRTANTKSRVDGIAPITTNGVRRVQTFASAAALTAVPAAKRADGDIAFVVGLGLFWFVAASVVAADGVFVIVTDDTSGRWISNVFMSISIANGVARLDGSSRLPAATARNGIIANASFATSNAQETAGAGYWERNVLNGAWTTSGIGQTTAMVVAVGDVVFLSAAFSVNPAGNGKLRMAFIAGATTALLGSAVTLTLNTPQTYAVSLPWVSTVAGSVVFAIQSNPTAAGDGVDYRWGGAITAIAMRP